MVAHLVDVGAARSVGLGGEQAAVGVLAHADDVGRHHPAEAVDEGGGEPLGQLAGPIRPLQGVVAQDHQALDVVGPAAIAHPSQRVVEALGAHRGGVRPVHQSGSGIVAFSALLSM